MSKEAISSKNSILEKLQSIRADLQAAQDIFTTSKSRAPILPRIPEQPMVTMAPEILKSLREIREDLQEILARLNQGSMVPRPLNDYLWWFSVKVWFQAGIRVPQDSEDVELDQGMIQGLLKATEDVKMEVFQGVEVLRAARLRTVETKEFKELTTYQILTIVEKVTEVLLIKKSQAVIVSNSVDV